MDQRELYLLAADLIVVLHALYAACVVFGFVAVVVGYWLKWNWIRSFWFRIVHLAMLLIVVVQSYLGVPCILTVWENRLRAAGGGQQYYGTFIGHWVHELLMYDAPQWVFTLIYSLFALAVIATLVLVPPKWPWSLVHRRQD